MLERFWSWIDDEHAVILRHMTFYRNKYIFALMNVT